MRRLPLNTLVLAVMAPVIALSTAGFGYAAYVRLYATILEGFDRKLAALSSATSAYIDTDETLALLGAKDAIAARGQNPEDHPSYVKYVRPMRRIRERAGLTFLYTQMLKPGQERQCVYLLDGTVGAGHSELGAVDTIPEADWDVALRVLHDGEVAQTAIRPWEQWGLLKCGWAPMYGADGRIKAMSGADVEITVIRQKTYVALLQTLGAGALALILASLVSVRVARKLTRPLGEVREAALRIASGDFLVRCHVENPREMRTLAGTVNALARMMETTVEETQRRMDAWRRLHAGRALIERLSLAPYRSADLAITLPAGRASGCVMTGPLALLWEGPQESDELTALKSARDIEQVARPLLLRHGSAAAAQLQHLFAGRVLGSALIDVHAWSVEMCGAALSLTVRGPAESVDSRTVIAPGAVAIVMPSGGTVPGSDAIAADATATIDLLGAHSSGAQGGIMAVLQRPAGTRRERDA